MKNTIFSIIPLTIGIACGHLVQADDTGYFLDASTCTKQAAVTERIELNSGIYTERVIASSPLSIRISRGFHRGRYGKCMQGLGRAENIADNPYLRITAECREEARVAPEFRITRKNGHMLPASHDLATYERCVQRRTRALDVEVRISSSDR